MTVVFEPLRQRVEMRAGAADEPVDMVPPSIPWPSNLFIIGTVNMDETTYPFSDKVLDRAFTFEFWEADLKAWRDRVKTEVEQSLLTRRYTEEASEFIRENREKPFFAYVAHSRPHITLHTEERFRRLRGRTARR